MSALPTPAAGAELPRPAAAPLAIEIRRLAARDSIEAITELLHRAYAALAARGMNFRAAAQDSQATAQRIAEGQCLVAELRGRIVGTITVCGPYDPARVPWTGGAPSFRDRDTAHIHQFAIDPGLQGQGIGRRLVAACEHWALDHGYRRMAVDTAEPAPELRAMYQRMGYSEVSRVQLDGRSYRSVIMEKPLDRSPLREQLRLMARFNLWATRRMYQGIDMLPDADYRREIGLPHKSVHGTLNRLLVGEHAVWFRRFAEGANPRLALDTEIEPDRMQMRERLIDGALQWLPLLEIWPEARLLGRMGYQRQTGEQASLPFAATLAHVFNHGTHHRAQIAAAVALLGHHCPDIDLLSMLHEESHLG